MKTCTFFGNHDCGDEIKWELLSTIEDCIAFEDVAFFYVGNNGNFDRMVIALLRKLKDKYPHITYEIVLAYHPSLERRGEYTPDESVVPDGIEKLPKRYAIAYRNDWMLKKAEYVICYMRNKYGSAFKYVEKAARAGKKILCISGDESRTF